jgi:hypothetical protein
MPTRFVDFQTVGGVRRTVNAFQVLRIAGHGQGTSLVELTRPQAAIIVIGDEEEVRARIADAINATISMDVAIAPEAAKTNPGG